MKRCPKCSTPLHRRRFDGLEVDGCAGCGGVWLDSGEFDNLVRGGPGLIGKIETAIEPVQPAPANPTHACPVCQSKLVDSGRSSVLAGVDYQQCPSCRGHWFENQELKKAASAIYPDSVSAPPRAPRAPVAAEPARPVEPRLLDRRTFFVGDRVTWSQVALLLISGLVVTILEKAEVTGTVISYGWIVGLVVVLVAYIVIKYRKQALYYDRHWLSTFWLMFLIWISVSVWAGVFMDSRYGTGNALAVSVVVAFMNLTGYYLARLIRKTRHSTPRGKLKALVAFFSIAFIAVMAWLGVLVIQRGLAECEISWSFDNAKTCQTCLYGIYLIILGIGMVISMLINIFMLHCLYDPKGLDVEENTPNELYLKMMIGSMIITFIAWLLLLLLVPPVAGGGGGGGKRSSSRSSSSSRLGRYRSFDGYGLGFTDRERIEEEWGEHGLEK